MSRNVATILAVALLTVGCATMRQIAGVQSQPEPSVSLKSAETRWLLIQNPRFGDIPSEPEYIWVEEDKVPTTFKTFFRGKSAIIAAPEIVAKYGAPPGGGKISPRQKVPYQAAEPSRHDGNGRVAGAPVAPTSAISRTAVSTSAVSASAAPTTAVSTTATSSLTTATASLTPVVPAPEIPKRGYVVYIDTTRVVIDLSASDGLRPGSIISLRRDKIPIIHPVTGEMLGELDEEVAIARVTETRDRFSVAEIQSVTPGSQIQVKDRVVLK